MDSRGTEIVVDDLREPKSLLASLLTSLAASASTQFVLCDWYFPSCRFFKSCRTGLWCGVCPCKLFCRRALLSATSTTGIAGFCRDAVEFETGLNLSVTLDREAAVVAVAAATGCRFRVLRNGGESLGGGGLTIAWTLWFGSRNLLGGLYRRDVSSIGELAACWSWDVCAGRDRDLVALCVDPISEALLARGTGILDEDAFLL